MAQPIIEARCVTKRFSKRTGFLRRGLNSITAVDQVNCAVYPGETVGLVGESGSGKTTLAKLLVGLIAPTSGEILIHGQPFSGLRGRGLLSARRSLQFVFQSPTNSLNPRMSVEETLSEPLLIHRLAAKKERYKRVEELLESVQLAAAYRKRLPRQLSQGERQRVGIARALATDPEMLICDEPIASLDVSVGAQILELLRNLIRQRCMALLFISHDLKAVASLCERIAVMRDGKFLEEGQTAQVLSRPQNHYTELLIRSAQLDLDALAS